MKASAVKVVIMLLGVGLAALGFKFGRVVPFGEQWPMFEALRTTASIIFAVIGAWLAIIYPDRLKLSFSAQDQVNPQTRSGIGQLFTPVVHSTAILCVILALGVIAPILKRQDWTTLGISIETLRGCSYALLVLLTIWQLWTVILTLIPADTVKTAADREDRHVKTVAGYKGN